MMDDLDKQLVNILEKDAWQSADALAKQLSTSASTIRRKIKLLLKNGTIRIVAQSNPEKIGLPITALMVFDVSAGKVDTVIEALENRPEVRWAAVTIGRFDVVAFLRLPSTNHLFNFIKHEIANVEGVKNTETLICTHTIKRGHYLHL